MKCLLIILTLAIASIHCFESLDCVQNSDCPSSHQFCVLGECCVEVPKGGSDSIPCVPECPSNEACYWGTCVRASRKVVQRKMSWPDCQWDWECNGTFNFCVLGKCIY